LILLQASLWRGKLHGLDVFQMITQIWRGGPQRQWRAFKTARFAIDA